MSQSGRYQKVVLTNLTIWERCSDVASDSAGRNMSDTPGLPDYHIQPLPHCPQSLSRHYVILQPDGSIWRDGSLYLFEKAMRGAKDTTLANIGGDLTHFANEMNQANKDYLDFDGPSFNRPTYYYRQQLKKLISKGASRKTQNRKISSMVGFYRFKTSKGFKPTQDMWQSTTKIISRPDRHGFQHAFEVICTDLTFPINSSNNFDCIQDGGNLYPIARDDQKNLLIALRQLANPEMLFIHIIAMTTGMRIQTILTLRIKSIKQDIKMSEEDVLFPVPTGPDTGVDTKRDKSGMVLMPGWVHQLLTTYLNSERAVYRRKQSELEDNGNQYLFLTRTGNPYYIAEEDKHIYVSSEAGSAVRQFQTRINGKLKQIGQHFKYRFHDLRATFGMNLLEDHIAKNQKIVEKIGITSYLQLHEMEIIDMIKSRMNHSSIEVTQGYLRYKQNHDLVGRAQTEFESHLRDFATEHWNKHGTNFPERDDY